MGRKLHGKGTFARNNIRLYRDRAGFSLKILSELTGISQGHLSRLEHYNRRVSLDVLEKIASSIPDCTVAMLIDLPDECVTAAVVSTYVESGEWQEASEWELDDSYEVEVNDTGQYPGIEKHASVIIGNSMNKVLPGGSVIIWVDHAETKKPLIPGKRYVVKRTRDDGEIEMSCRTYLRSASGLEFFYDESNDPDFQETVSLVDDKSGAVTEVVGLVIQAIITV